MKVLPRTRISPLESDERVGRLPGSRSGVRRRAPRRALTLIALAHAALFLWAAAAWIAGPFRGEGVIDGHEVLALAQTGSAGPFETKSPLYAWVLGGLLRVTGETPWTVALFGLALSLTLLLGSARLALRLAGPGAAVAAAALYAVSGSALALGVQPLPALCASALLLWGALAVESARERDGPARSLAGGALLVAAVLARASLLPAALLVLARGVGARRSVAAGALIALVAGVALFGARAWPEGGALNLRLGNGAQRAGFPELPPGPRYDDLRFEALAAQPRHRPLVPAARWQLMLLGRELADDPLGSLATLLRKAWLFWHRTEIVASADFRHGLRELPLAPILLESFALVAPLALLGLARRRHPLLLLPVAGVLFANVLFVTCARYRFPALPFLCGAAGCALVPAPRWRELASLVALAALLWPNFSGYALRVAKQGLVQEGHLRLLADPLSPEGRAALEAAVGESRDPRAHYLLGVHHTKRWLASNRTDAQALASADRHFARALELEPSYSEAAENRVRILARAGRTEEAIAFAYATLPRAPRAGLLQLELAALLVRENPLVDVRSLRAEGHGILALHAVSEHEMDRAREHAREAVRHGSYDARVTGLLAPGDRAGAAGSR